jgi:hypothetical protein
MAFTVSSFKVAYPEFANTPDATVQAKLDMAYRGLDSRRFGDRYDDAVGLKTAHLLSLAPFGTQARLESDDTQTTYGVQLGEMVRQCAGGPWAAGQTL